MGCIVEYKDREGREHEIESVHHKKLTRLYFPTLIQSCDRKCIYVLFLATATATVNDSIQSTLEMPILGMFMIEGHSLSTTELNLI